MSASDSVVLSGLDETNIVETKIPDTFTPVITPVVAPVIKETPTIKETKIIKTASVAPKTVVPATNITINGKAIALKSVDSTTVESGSGANKIGKLIYGHNSAAVFGNLNSLNIGATFTITENGETTTYKVAKKTVYEKNADGRLQLNGSGSYMKAIRDRALGHSIALMTCVGTSYGAGDASHRLVILADAI